MPSRNTSIANGAQHTRKVATVAKSTRAKCAWWFILFLYCRKKSCLLTLLFHLCTTELTEIFLGLPWALFSDIESHESSSSLIVSALAGTSCLPCGAKTRFVELSLGFKLKVTSVLEGLIVSNAIPSEVFCSVVCKSWFCLT